MDGVDGERGVPCSQQHMLTSSLYPTLHHRSLTLRYPILGSGIVVNEGGSCLLSHSNPVSLSGLKLMTDADCTYRGSDLIMSSNAAVVVGPHSVFTVETPVNVYATTADAGEIVNGGTLHLTKQGSVNVRVPLINRGSVKVSAPTHCSH